MFRNKFIFLYILFLYYCIPTLAQEDRNYKVENELYSYYHRCQENIKYPKSLLMADTLFNMAKEKKDIRMQAVAKAVKLDHFYFNGTNEDSIFFYFDKVKKFAAENNQWKYYYFAWGDRLILHYLKTGKINIALYQAQEMLKEAQSQDSKIGLLACYNSLYQIYEVKGLRSLAIEYCLKAIELTEKYEMDNYNIAFSYAEAAKYYIIQNNLDLALDYLKKAEATANAEIHLINVKMNYMYYYLAQNDSKKAWEILQECKADFEKDKKSAVGRKMYYDSEYYYYKKTGQYQKALESTDRKISEEQGLNEQALRSGQYRKKGEIYLAMNRKELAANYLSKYIQLEDSIKLRNEDLTASGYATLVNLEKVEREKKELILHNQEKELRNKQIIIFSLVIILLVVLYFLYRENLLNKRLIYSEDELRKAKDKAEFASHAKTRFIQSMSHEIRTPLNSIVGFSQILGSINQNDAEAKEYASIIETNSNNLLRLINYALELSNLDKGENIDVSFVTDVNNCCRVSLESVKDNLNKGVELNFNPSSKDLIVKSNPERIMQVLSNLLHNATKFTKQGSISLGYVYSEVEQKIYFSIADTGCGIPQEKHSEVFERFTKLDSFSQGTGLGLSISKEIALQMNGELYIDKEYMKGTKFIFAIPYN